MKGDQQRCLQAGMDDYISKPIDPVKFFQVIDRNVGTAGRESSDKDLATASDPVTAGWTAFDLAEARALCGGDQQRLRLLNLHREEDELYLRYAVDRSR